MTSSPDRNIAHFDAGELHRFTTLHEALPVLAELNLDAQPGSFADQVILPVVNSDISYDMTITHVPASDAVYLGAQLGTVQDLPEPLALDILIENQFVNHAKLSINQQQGNDSYELVASTEIRTPFLTNEALLDNIRSFDSAVTFEYTQIRALATKHAVEILGMPQYRNLGSQMELP